MTWRKYYKRQELITLREDLGSPTVFTGVCVARHFSFLCCVVILHFVCHRPASCVPSVSGLYIRGRPSVLSNVYFTLLHNNINNNV